MPWIQAVWLVNTWRAEQDGPHFAGDNFNDIFVKVKKFVLI